MHEEIAYLLSLEIMVCRKMKVLHFTCSIDGHDFLKESTTTTIFFKKKGVVHLK
jgi:hypothetical protein